MRQERGIVAIFVVIFSSLLLTLIAVSFTRLMILEQQQSLDNDLSQSALDSARAGVEDGKRVLRLCEASGNPDSVACREIRAYRCTTVHESGIVQSSSAAQTMIISNGQTTSSLDQAYTCVKIKQDTEDVLYNLAEGRSVLIPLKSSEPIRQISVEWMHRNTDNSYIGDAPSGELEPPIDSSGGLLLPQKSQWSPDAPSLLRAQILLASGGVQPSDLDSSIVATRFLYPFPVDKVTGVDAAIPASVSLGGQRAASSQAAVRTDPSPVTCYDSLYQSDTYACRAVLVPDAAINPGSTTAYIRLSSLYKSTSIRLSLLSDSGATVLFDGVQPEIDSTGRANNVYRRISSRVSSMIRDVDLPEYAVDLSGSFCKSFWVTPDQSGNASPVCTP